jgi:hypothetical protein
LGAYSFPPAVPLALLEKPLGAPELTALAASLRALSLEAGSGVFTADSGAPPLLVSGPGGFSFWGLPLNIPVPSLPSSLPFPRAALCAAVAGSDSAAEREIILRAGDPPLPRFRAAAAANLAVEFLPGDGCAPGKEDAIAGLSSRWLIGKPHWLKRCNNRNE